MRAIIRIVQNAKIAKTRRTAARVGGIVGAVTAVAVLWISACAYFANPPSNPFAESPAQAFGQAGVATPFAAVIGVLIGALVGALTAGALSIGLAFSRRGPSSSTAARIVVAVSLFCSAVVTAIVIAGFGIPLPTPA